MTILGKRLMVQDVGEDVVETFQIPSILGRNATHDIQKIKGGK